MTLRWTNWCDDPSADTGISPYVDWLRTATFEGKEVHEGLSLAPLPLPKSVTKGNSDQSHGNSRSVPAPLPEFARPGQSRSPQTDPQISLTWMPDADSTIIGLIDSAIALAHARFRRIDGGTRVLSAWLQAGEWRDPAAVPFGRELFRTEIDRLMWRATLGGAIDEDAFDRSAGLTQFHHPRGDRRLNENATHGTHVGDLAAGFELRDSSADEARRRLPIIAVGLPPRACIGASGNFLEFYAIHAVDYIIDRADRIWSACGYGDGGFPIVINLSYGLQAGPKDGQKLIEKVIRVATERAETEGRPIRVVLPAGNDLLSEGAADFRVSASQKVDLDWRIRPGDHTPNYAEIWSDVIAGKAHKKASHPLTVSLAPPGGPAGPNGAGKAGQIATLIDDADPNTPLAKIYCRLHDNTPLHGSPGSPWHRLVYVLCTRQTLGNSISPTSPAGRWAISVSPNGNEAQRGFAYVQSDQSLTFGSETGLVSSFAHPEFEADDESGRPIDAWSYPTDDTAPVLTDTTPPMMRRGTLNAIASSNSVRVIGSYRRTDGAPSVFSSAASSGAVGNGRAAPTALLPGDDGAARFGLMAAGSRSGSAAVMQGTSFSTALATRRIALAMLEWIDTGCVGEAPGSETWFQAMAMQDELSLGYPGKVMAEKAGAGRLAAPATGRMPR